MFAMAAGIVLVLPAESAELRPEVRSSTLSAPMSVVSEDPYANSSAFHQTEGEPDAFAFGSTIVSAFMVGYHRSPPGGASNIGWSLSSDGGETWKDDFLPGTTPWASPPGPWFKVADPAVAYDAKHATWLIVALGASRPSTRGMSFRHTVFVSRSTDGAKTFGRPVIVKAPSDTQAFDKTWIACDNTATSEFYGHCYIEWDDEGHDLRLHMSTSTDGGLKWSRASIRRDTHVINGHPLVQPNGVVVMPILACCETRIEAFVSVDGGLNYSGHGTGYAGPLLIPNVRMSPVSGELFVGIEPPAIGAAVDASGKVSVVWADCRSGPDTDGGACKKNSLFMSTTLDGRHWSPIVPLPTGDRSTSADHFLPAIGIDPSTAGTSAHIGVLYYFYPVADCSADKCDLSVGFISSTDGGATWDRQQLAGPFRNTWLPPGEFGHRPGDYFDVTFVDGHAVAVFTAASEGGCALGEISCHTWIASATLPVA